MDVVWLKKDVRLIDHAPLSIVAQESESESSKNIPLLILYVYEPDQLAEHSVHGSHVAFCNEGLVDLDLQLSCTGTANEHTLKKPTTKTDEYEFQVLTVCYAGFVYTLQQILNQHPIRRLLCHMETGHLKSYSRDRAVRKWCKAKGIPIFEYNQTGVTRCLKNRDDYLDLFKIFVNQPIPRTPTERQLKMMRSRLINTKTTLRLFRLLSSPLPITEITQIPLEHRVDRQDRQQSGGERKGIESLESFLMQRGRHYSSGISSPNTAWTTCARISPYLTFGHLSTRFVIHRLMQRQQELRNMKATNTLDLPRDGPFLRSLANFSSRIHWRSHFIQKLESEPEIEIRDLCPAYQHLRRQKGDWNEEYYQAWSKGLTGFPFVDACQRALIKTGWLNFRMRAMLVSFATYNLWLDWIRIAPHLARVFLDYEPGIHYPQIQMQAGTTGINAMRVYSVTKQGRDQDPDGVFIRKYVEELQHVPKEFIHEPHKMDLKTQQKYKVCIVKKNSDMQGKSSSSSTTNIKQYFNVVNNKNEASTSNITNSSFSSSSSFFSCFQYPAPIVNETSTAKIAKDKVAAVRKQLTTMKEAQQVFVKHGSRKNSRMMGDMNGTKPKALSSSIKRVKLDKQTGNDNTIKSMFQKSLGNLSSSSSSSKNVTSSSSTSSTRGETIIIDLVDDDSDDKQDEEVIVESNNDYGDCGRITLPEKSSSLTSFFAVRTTPQQLSSSTGATAWSCKFCTFLNKNPNNTLVCEICGGKK